VNNVKVIHCWSTPRSRSTALLYSFEARDDCVVMDEPLYGKWLLENKEVERPYKQFLINPTEAGENKAKWEIERLSFEERIKQCIEKLKEKNISKGFIFVKHISKFEQVYDFVNEVEGVHHIHMILIRDPATVLRSWDGSCENHSKSCDQNEIGFVPLLLVASKLMKNNSLFKVLDSDEIVKNPQKSFKNLCMYLNIPFQNSMLQWKTGPHECDGPWGAWWYHNVHCSTGWFMKQEKNSYKILPDYLLNALRMSNPVYEYLKTLSIKTFEYPDPRNANLLVWIGRPGNGRIIPREMAGVNPWDSSVQGGDAVWEGLRIYDGKILSLEKHLKRLEKSAKALAFQNMHTHDEIKEAIFQTLAANGMRDGAHIRLTVTRGEKYTSSMNPIFNVYGTTLLILPEWKPVEGTTTYDNAKGIALISASTRRNSPSCGVDSKIHHNNMINNILPKIQANAANCQDAIMLDIDGYVSETNATNIFLVDDSVLKTPHADHCLPGITRETVLVLAKQLSIPTEIRRVSLAEFYAADEVFTTGTMGEITPVTIIDGRTIGNGKLGSITHLLQNEYKKLPNLGSEWCTELPEFT